MAAGSLDMDVDSPPHLPIETSANKVILDGEEHSLEVPAANPLEDSSARMNRLIVMQKRLLEAKKRKRSISSVHTSNSVHLDTQLTSSPTPVSPVQKRRKRVGSKNH